MPSPSGPPRTLTVLGCDGSYPGPGGAASGYLVRAGAVALWLDAGPGTFARLQTVCDPGAVQAVVLSHEHPDHWSDLESFAAWLLPHGGGRRVRVLAPPGLRRRSYFADHPQLEWTEAAPSDRVLIGGAGGLDCRFVATDHGPPTLAVRIDPPGTGAGDLSGSLAYTADTGPDWSVEELGAGMGTVLCEASYTRESEGRHRHLSGARPAPWRRRLGWGRSCSPTGGLRCRPRPSPTRRPRPSAAPCPRRRPVRCSNGERAGSGRRKVGAVSDAGETEGRAVDAGTARADGRALDQLRPVAFERDFTVFAPGSVLVSMGRTKVLCTASVEERVPPWTRGRGKGWVTAEYSMLPGSTAERAGREAAKGKQSGRTQEIQRLTARSLRAVCDLVALGEVQVTVDCDVLQADGGTRTASICGAYVALHDAFSRLQAGGQLSRHPITEAVAAVSVGIVDGVPMLDLPYEEDSRAEVDMNVVMTGDGRFIEVQGTAEGQAFSRGELDQLLSLAERGIAELMVEQATVLATPPRPR